MTVRKWLTTAAVAAGLGLGSALPAFAAKNVEFTFGALKAATPEAGKAQAEGWLKKVGKFDPAAFDRIWKQDEASVLDRTLATLELGSPEARAALKSAQDATNEAPKEVPAVLKDAKADPYLRANLAVGWAKALTAGRVYEESLAALNAAKAEETVDPAAYLFYRAVAEHALMKKDDAMRSIVRLLDDVSGAPDRYAMLGRILFVEMATWTKDEKDLANIRRLMDNSERRLGLARGGKTTQTIQKKIVFRLDELIKEKENQAKGGGQANGGACPSGGQGNQIGQGNIRSNSHAPDSAIMTGSGPGTVDEKKLKTLAKSWGTMPEKERAKAIMDLTRDLPARYRVVIEDYFKALSGASKTP